MTTQKFNKDKYCRVCGELLVIGDNWRTCNEKKGIYTCSLCQLSKDRQRLYGITNKDYNNLLKDKMDVVPFVESHQEQSPYL